jgi:hypothetical protein
LGRRGTHIDIGGKTGRKETTGKAKRKGVDNIKLDLTKRDMMGWCGLD